jgi:hypothetical protein
MFSVNGYRETQVSPVHPSYAHHIHTIMLQDSFDNTSQSRAADPEQQEAKVTMEFVFS